MQLNASARRFTPAHRVIKITKPTLSGVYVRERLNILLDAACRSPVVWVSSPAGSGKTTAIASYIDSRKLCAVWYQIDASDTDIGSFFHYMSLAIRSAAGNKVRLPVFTAEYFEHPAAFVALYFRELFTCLAQPSVLVFDNFQELAAARTSAECSLHEALLQGLLHAPVGTTMIFLSREDAPPPFARLRASCQMARVGWDALQFTEEESVAVVQARLEGRSAGVRAQRLHRQTQGWVAGLLLLAERDAGERIAEEASPEEERMSDALQGCEAQLIFDYLGYEIFRHTTALEQELLLTTALLPYVDIEIVQALTQREGHDPVLQRLARRNFFTILHADGTYEYHPLFRAFLLSRAEQHLGETRLRELRVRVAQLLADRGDIEAGIGLLLQVHEWSGALELILAGARKMLDQGRVHTLARWLRALPEEFRKTNAWALYWLGLCEMHVSGAVSVAAARELLQEAMAKFEQHDDVASVVRCWCAIVDNMMVEWNDFTRLGQWLDRFRALTRNLRIADREVEAASVGSYLSGLLWSRPDDPDLRVYVERAESIFRHEADPLKRFAWAVKRLLPYHWWAGDLGKFRTICADISQSAPAAATAPVTRILWCMVRAQIAAITGAAEESLAAVAEGLAAAEASGARMFDVQLCREAIWAHISIGDIAAARRMLNRMSLSIDLDIRTSYFHLFTALVLVHEGQGTRALEEAGRALELSKYYVGILNCTTCVAAALIQTRSLGAAARRLAEARRMSEQIGSELWISTCDFLEAQIHRLTGNREGALAKLGEFLRFAQKYAVVVPGYVSRSEATDLLSYALAENYRSDEITNLICRSRLTPPANDIGVNWPWPVKIFTLGRFLVLRNGAPLVYSGKAQKKPLELLSALIAHGGRNVGMNNLAQVLWPDTEGDLGRSNLRTTLLRLRRLVGDAAVIQHGNGLSLNTQHCWLDVWALERVCDARCSRLETEERVERLRALYGGVFLPDNDDPWVINQRERLRTRALRPILDIGRQCEDTGRLGAAIDAYQKGIEIDSLAEELYRRLMRCYIRTNRAAEALVLYQRYRTLLNRSLQIEPAAETKSLFHKIQRLAM